MSNPKLSEFSAAHAMLPRRLFELAKIILSRVAQHPGYGSDDLLARLMPDLKSGGYRAEERAALDFEVMLRLLTAERFLRAKEDSHAHEWTYVITDKGRLALSLQEVPQ